MRLPLRLLTAASALCALLVPAAAALASDVPRTVTEDTMLALPKGVEMKTVTGNDLPGTIERVIRWTDAVGDNVAVFATTGKVGVKEDTRFESRSLHVATFVDRGGKLARVQKIVEYVAPCEYSLTARFIPAACGVTDADGDGVGELTIGYVTRCAGDVSPLGMKILVLQKDKRYALRGESEVDVGDGEMMGGEYKADFRKAPPALLEHARRTWAASKRQGLD